MTDRFNTIAGWTLFAGIVALGLSSVSSRIFHADKPESPEKPGYFIEGAEEEGGADSGPPLALLLAQGSAEAGEGVFAKCTACHSAEQGGPNGIGPDLWGVIGQPIGKHAAGFAYSSALAEHGGEWSYENLDAWLSSPRAFAPGTKMSFAGLSKLEDRANVILYLREHGGGPALPEPPAAEPEGEVGVDSPGEGPGPVAGEEASQVEAVGAMSDEQPVPSTNAATDAGGASKPGD